MRATDARGQGAGPPPVPLEEVFRRLAAELAAIARVARGLDVTLGGRSEVFAGLRPEDMRMLQRIDVLAQSIDGIAGFVSRLPALVPGGPKVDLAPAAEELRLRAQLDSLLHGCRPGEIFAEQEADREPELF